VTDYTLAELAALSGIPARTIRYYITQGLLPPPGREGPATRYPAATLDRLRLIARLRDAHQPLATIRARLAYLDDREVSELAASPEGPSEPPAGSALEYVRALLETGTVEETGARPLPRALAPHLRRLSIPIPDGPPAAPAPSEAAPSQDATWDLAADEEPQPAQDDRQLAGTDPAAPPTVIRQPATGERSQWERIAITTDIELHLRRPLSRRDNRVVDRLLAFARQLLGEEPT
jgi:DNA-binding transcriptional MerR regulator